MKGMLSCKVCGQQNITEINYLSAAVDVYADWVDKCDEAARLDREEQLKRRHSTSQPATRNTAAAGNSGRRNEVVDDDAEGYDDEDELPDISKPNRSGGGYQGEGIVDNEEDDY